jgi:Phosphoinositide phospholipase C, Ca2+-dependent
VMFLMDNAGQYRTDYLTGHPNLDGRILFTNANPGDPDAAFVKRNDPLGPNVAVIQDLVRRGYLVRTRADADTIQARTGDTTQRDAALLSGAQFVSTDYPVPGRAAPLGTDYVAQIPDGDPARCNPITTGALCRNEALERLQ